MVILEGSVCKEELGCSADSPRYIEAKELKAGLCYHT